MAGAGLLDLKRRIKSVTSTQKITKAMGLVATAKFKKVKNRAESITPYRDKYYEVIKNLAAGVNTDDSIFFSKNGSDKNVYIVISSNSGLCGGYNTNIINLAKNKIDADKDSVIIVGEKALNFFAKKNYNITGKFTEVGDTPSFKEASDILRPAVEAFEKGEAGNVFLVYTRFYSQIKQSAEIVKILPMEKEEGVEETEIIFEPSKEEVFKYVLPKYLNTVMFHAVCNAIASEFAARMSSMDNATKNAQELLDKLNLMYNRARQSSITQEITEIVGGAEALKD